MRERSVAIIGLPGSGKTTYLAALWHVITSCEMNTRLRLGDLREGNWKHLNSIAARWRQAIVQERTAMAGERRVSMNLRDGIGGILRVSFPDVPGEAYSRMWEDRDCSRGVAEMVGGGGILLFVNADTIRPPNWTVDEVALAEAIGAGGPDGPVEEWTPGAAPTQVQLVDILQLLRMAPLDAGPRRVGVMLSAWDRARPEELRPDEYVGAKLPLLRQYFRSGPDGWLWRAYGVSAQGGVYDRSQEAAGQEEEARRLRELELPSRRIQVVGPDGETSDPTEPLVWLMG